MEPKEDPIKLLEMRIRQQIASSSEKTFNPENVQYHIHSAMLQKEKPGQSFAGGEEKTNSRAVYDRAENTGEQNESPPEKSGSEGLPAVNYMDRADERILMMEYIKGSKTQKAQHRKARNKYKKAYDPLDAAPFLQDGEAYFFDIKG